MGSFIWFFGLITFSMPAGLAIYHYAIKERKNGKTQNQDCCCKAEQQSSGCSSCQESCKK